MVVKVTANACRVLLVGRSPRLLRVAEHLFHGGVVEAAPQVGDFGRMLDAVHRHHPSVVVVDLEDASLEGVAAIEMVMAEQPVPILVLSAPRTNKQDAIRALGAGALEIAEVKDTADSMKALHRQVQFLARVKVVKHVKGSKRLTKTEGERPNHPVVAVAASLGGPKALARLLSALPRNFEAPITLCQHITPGFADDLARYLAVETGHDVIEAIDGQLLKPGRVFVAPSERHLLVQHDGSLKLDPGPPVGGFRPSCDVLLRSVAAAFGSAAIGVVLTGMGKDGARGLKEIRARGGHTIAQDQATSVVFGMPGEAIALGAAERVLPLEEIAGQLVKWVRP